MYDDLIAALKEWRLNSGSYFFMDFLNSYDISWTWFKAVMARSIEVQEEFDKAVTACGLRWANYGFNQTKLPPHLQTLMMHYLKKYDLQAFDKDLEAKKEVASHEVKMAMSFKEENYANAPLEAPYDALFAANAKPKSQ